MPTRISNSLSPSLTTSMRPLIDESTKPLQWAMDPVDFLDANIEAAKLTNPQVRCIGTSVNTAFMPEAAALAYLAEVERQLGMPAVDPFRTGVGRLVDRLA